ncbi:MAG: hypothetical protein AAFY56_08450 [Pseudomonadota bacterium]
MSMLLLGLSIISLSFLAFAMNESSATQKTIDQIDIDNALENVFVSAVANMLDTGDLQIRERHPIGRANTLYTFRAVASEEALKLDVLRAPEADVEAAMETYFRDDDTRKILRDAIRSARTQIGNHAEVFERLRHSKSLSRSSWWCFSRHFTYFQPPNRIRRVNSERSPRGEMFSILVSVRHEGRNVRALDAVILLTGREDEPFWVYRWEKYSGAEAGSCPNETH